MKKRFALVFILILSVSLVSAGFWSDLFSPRISGKVIEDLCTLCPDLNNDGMVDETDASLLYACAPNCPDSYDLNSDGIISILSDVNCLVENLDKSVNEIEACKEIIEPLTCIKCPDLNNDGIVNNKDTSLFYACAPNCPESYDLNSDGIISILSDVNCLVENLDKNANEIEVCEALCTPSCENKKCGNDGCGGVCGACLENEICNNDQVCEDIVEIPSCIECPDLNNDGIVDETDASLLYACAPNCPDNYDLNSDGIISILSDVNCLVENLDKSVNEIEACEEIFLANCSDGTKYNSCSLAKPKYCDSENLINNCSFCGCDEGYGCKENEDCEKNDYFEIMEFGLMNPFGDLKDTLFISQSLGIIAQIKDTLGRGIKNVEMKILLNGKIISQIELNLLVDYEPIYIYEGDWTTIKALEGKNNYTVQLIIEDDLRKITIEDKNLSLLFEFPELIDNSNCKELIPGHNSPFENRANIVFVGFGYENITGKTEGEVVESISRYIVDMEGERHGLFKFRPFKSNKDKFNLWYINENIYSSENCSRRSHEYNTPLDCPIPYQFSRDCIFGNKYDVILINVNFRSSASPKRSFISAPVWIEGPNQGRISDDVKLINLNEDNGLMYSDNLDKLFVHEFGHEFANLRDEYIENGINYTLNYSEGNCYAGPQHTKQECIQNTQWKEFIGDGCGKENIIDCQKGIDENYNLEIGCYESCLKYKFGIFRSSFNTIMRCYTCEPYSFGLWNEKLIQDKLNKFDSII